MRAGEREAGNGFPPPFDRDQGIPAPYQSSDDDLAHLDTAFCTVWHRQRLMLLGGLHSEVAMLNWEFQDAGATTTSAVWRL